MDLPFFISVKIKNYITLRITKLYLFTRILVEYIMITLMAIILILTCNSVDAQVLYPYPTPSDSLDSLEKDERKITGAPVACEDPFGKGGFSSDLDALLAGTSGLRRNGPLTYGLVRFSNGGGAGGVGDLTGGIGPSSVKPQRRGRVSASFFLSIYSDESDYFPRSSKAIKRTVHKRVGGIKYIYNKYLQDYPNISGMVIVEMKIAPSGTVIETNMISSAIGVPEFQIEILKRIKRFKFARVEKGITTVYYPFEFYVPKKE